MFKFFTILFFTFIQTLGSCGNQIKGEVFLVPKGYQGPIYIIFDQTNGVPPKYEQQKLIYEIPLDGVLRTQSKLNVGWQNLPLIYYIDNFGKRFAMPYLLEPKDVNDSTIQACCLSSGTTLKDGKNIETSFLVFYIGTEKVIDSCYENSSKINLSRYLDN